MSTQPSLRSGHSSDGSWALERGEIEAGHLRTAPSDVQCSLGSVLERAVDVVGVSSMRAGKIFRVEDL